MSLEDRCLKVSLENYQFLNWGQIAHEEGAMARPNLKMHTEPVTRGYQKNVVPFDNHRRRLQIAHSSADETHSRGVVVRLSLPAGSPALEGTADARTFASDSNRDRLTPIDWIVAFLLFLSTLTGPALAWALLS
jgi:hypothetical protein